jgi:hypothetical protein
VDLWIGDDRGAVVEDERVAETIPKDKDADEYDERDRPPQSLRERRTDMAFA